MLGRNYHTWRQVQVVSTACLDSLKPVCRSAKKHVCVTRQQGSGLQCLSYAGLSYLYCLLIASHHEDCQLWLWAQWSQGQTLKALAQQCLHSRTKAHANAWVAAVRTAIPVSGPAACALRSGLPQAHCVPVATAAVPRVASERPALALLHFACSSAQYVRRVI